MANLMEILGKGLIGSLWSIFGKRLDRFKDKSESLKIRLVERPEDVDLLLSLAVSFYVEDLKEKSLQTAEKLVKLKPDWLEANEIYACALESVGKRKEAIAVLENLVEHHRHHDAGIYFALGVLFETIKDQARASHYYEKTLTMVPNLINAHQRLAAMAMNNKQSAVAIEHYDALCKIDPEDVNSRILLASLFLNNGQPGKAISEYQIAMTIEPDNWSCDDELVRAYVKAGDYDKAIELLEDQIKKEHEFPDTHLQLAELYAKIGDDESAQKNYHMALAMHPGFLEAFVKFGTYHLKLGRYREAAEQFSQAIDVNDRLMNAYAGLAVAQYHTKHSENASEVIEMARAIEPNTTMLFAEVARLELKASAAKEAKDYLNPQVDQKPLAKELLDVQIDRFETAIQECPERADWHYRYGLLLKANGKIAAAADAFKQAVLRNPDYVKALVKLGLTLSELGQKDEAENYLERAVMLKPDFVDVHYELGLIYADQCRYRLAIEEFEKTLEKQGQRVDAMAAMAMALENIGMHIEARASWQAIIELAPMSEQAKLAKASLG